LGLLDDAALIDPPAGHQVVVTKDLMIAGVHFLPDDPPALVGRKLLRVNLSDLAAMGASPHGYVLGLCLSPETDDDWIAAFADGLRADQQEFGVVLLGGDTTATPGPLTLSLTAIGFVPSGAALQRGGGKPGDLVFVSGTIGDAALGLLALRGELEDPSGHLASRYRLPRPRLALGATLRSLASAALDVSDGLMADLGHLCEVSGVSAVLRVHDVPLSEAASQAVARAPALLETVLTGGDDYELVFAAPPAARKPVLALASRCGVAVTEVGALAAAGARTVEARDRQGHVMNFSRAGYRHR
ncbi:MAG: thiamine-phosphate kinase, partial [Alphaproteobacteria bacterium]|nr:thiamine-phosphate kinase [Alphaproteobacteria bacterium]